MKNTKSIQIKTSQIHKLEFGNALQQRNPNQSLEIGEMLKIAANKMGASGMKVAITFLSKNRGLFKIVDTVLMSGREYLVLKGGTTIPLSSVVRISM